MEVDTTMKMGMMKEFLEFMKEYKALALAIAFIMGAAATTLVKSLVDNIIMPLTTPFLPAGNWKTAVFEIWKFKFGWGAFLSEVISFAILAWVIFMIAKFILKEEKVAKK